MLHSAAPLRLTLTLLYTCTRAPTREKFPDHPQHHVRPQKIVEIDRMVGVSGTEHPGAQDKRPSRGSVGQRVGAQRPNLQETEKASDRQHQNEALRQRSLAAGLHTFQKTHSRALVEGQPDK